MPRRGAYRHPPRTSSRPGPVTVRSLSDPKAGWSLDDAVALVCHGYTPDRVEQVTGWAASVLVAQVRLRERRLNASGPA